MSDEIVYKCKTGSCDNDVVISKRVFEYMKEKGESLPERCDECRQKNLKEKREVRISYFDQHQPAGGLSFSSFSPYNYTPHGDRGYTETLPSFEESGLNVRMTDDHIRELYDKLEDNQVVILASPTGTGKSVYVLYRLLEPPTQYKGRFIHDLLHQGQVIQTQPLSAAVEKIPGVVSDKELKQSSVSPMNMLGLRHRGQENYGRHNLGVVVTDGSLRNWIRDGHLGRYSLIMVDEAHKRSLNIDSLLSLLQYKLPLHPHLKVIIASATINTNEFKEAFEGKGISTDVLDLSESLEELINYTVHFWGDGPKEECDCWLCRNTKIRQNLWNSRQPPSEGELPRAASSYVMEILKHTKEGSILVFLPGEAVIEKTKELLEEKISQVPDGNSIPVLPIYSRLGEEEVSRRFNTKGKTRRVLLTTDIAETSHTLDDVIYLVESGFIKQSQWDPESLTSTLPNIRHSKAGCRQRFGRVGRTAPGYVYCLYTKQQFNGFPDQTTPEIFRSQTDEVLLNLRSSGVKGNYSFIGEADDDPGFRYELQRSLSSISHEGYMDREGGVTEEGLDFFKVPLTAQKKSLLEAADEQGCLEEMIALVSALETEQGEARTGAESYNPKHGILVWDPRWTAETKMRVSLVLQALRTGCNDDMEFVLKILYCFLKAKEQGVEDDWAARNFVNYSVVNEILKKMKETREVFFTRAQDRNPRELDISRVVKLRSILARILKGREVEIKEGSKGLFYQLKENSEVQGYVSDGCTGKWKEADSVILLSATKKTGIVGGQERLVSVACGLAKKAPESSLDPSLFLDQYIPVKTRVVVEHKGNGGHVGKIRQEPPQLRVEYGVELDFAMLMDNYLRKDHVPQINYSREAIEETFRSLQQKPGIQWKDDRRDKVAIVNGWKQENGKVDAWVEPFNTNEVLRVINNSERIEAQVKGVFKTFDDVRGWALVEIQEGIEFPLEVSELSLSFFGNALRLLEGTWITLPVMEKDLEGMPVFSRTEFMLNDLEEWKYEIERNGEKEITAYVEKVDRDRNKIFVYTWEDPEIIHFFQVHSKRIPQGLEVDTAVPVKISFGDRSSCFMFRKLKSYERDSLPDGENWEYYEDRKCLHFPFFLRMEDTEEWELSDQDKERIIRNSWIYAFKADLNYS